MRPKGRISTHISFKIEILPVFRGNDLFVLMLKSTWGRKASLAAHPCGFLPA